MSHLRGRRLGIATRYIVNGKGVCTSLIGGISRIPTLRPYQFESISDVNVTSLESLQGRRNYMNRRFLEVS